MLHFDDKEYSFDTFKKTNFILCIENDSNSIPKV